MLSINNKFKTLFGADSPSRNFPNKLQKGALPRAWEIEREERLTFKSLRGGMWSPHRESKVGLDTAPPPT